MENRTSPAERAGYVVGALLLVSGLVHLATLVVTGGSWEGPVSLRKPVTFGFSFGLTLITIVWVSRFLKLGARARPALLAAFTAASVLETALVSLQAWRGVPSHFNVETGFDAWVTRGLAGGGIALVVMILAMTTAAFRRAEWVPASMRLAVRAGFLALCGAMAAGAVMIARGMMLVAQGAADTAYRTGGFLKPVHGVLMHGILVLPLLAWLAALGGWSERQRLRMVIAAVSGYALAAVLVTIGNLAGVL